MELQDTEFYGHKLVLHWGKPVPVSNEPLMLTSLGGNSTLYPSQNPPYYAAPAPADYYYSSYQPQQQQYQQQGNGAVYRPPPPEPPPTPAKALSEVSDRELSGMSVDSLLDSVRCTMDPTSSVTVQIQLPRDILIKGVIDSTARVVASGGQLQENVRFTVV